MKPGLRPACAGTLATFGSMTALPHPDPSSDSPAFLYAESVQPIRPDIVSAHRAGWHAIASPGSWWSGAERIAIAAEVRRALDCALCAERKAALSPSFVDGAHDAGDLLPDPAVDAAHRLVTDASRLTKSWLESLASQGLAAEPYVELLSVVVAVMSIDAFHRALGFPLEPLPAPIAGTPTGYRPGGLKEGDAWVPMLPIRSARGKEADLYDGLPMAPNVLAAMSLVPDGVRLLKTLSAAHYMKAADVGNAGASGNRAISRAQIELVAGRVSALNECFY